MPANNEELQGEVRRLRAALQKLTAWIAQSAVGVLSIAEAEEIIALAEPPTKVRK